MQRRAFLRHTALGTAALAAGPALAQAQSSRVRSKHVRYWSNVVDRTLYLDPESGNDANAGTRDAPLRTLTAAADLVGAITEPGPTTVILNEGVYAVDRTLRWGSRRPYSPAERLTIRAAVLPDDPEWHVGRMPTLIHTLPLSATWNGRPDPLGGAVDGMLIETSHVSILGLRLLGIPRIESPQPGLIRRLYGISRLDRELDDLEIGHGLFAGDELTTPFHVGVIAHGDDVDVHHSLFSGLKISVVYWTGGSSGHAMRHCLCHDLYGSAVWTSGIADNFVYRNNVVTDCNYVWTYQSGRSATADAGGGQAQQGAPSEPQNRYRVVDSIFANNRRLAGTGTGATLGYEDIAPSFLELAGSEIWGEPVVLEQDSTKRNYLHPVEGSEAAQIGAGLLTT